MSSLSPRIRSLASLSTSDESELDSTLDAEIESVVDEGAEQASACEHALHPTPLAHKFIMGTAVVLPFVGVITAMVLLWTIGWMGWLYLGLMLGGWLLTGLGITVGFHRLL